MMQLPVFRSLIRKRASRHRSARYERKVLHLQRKKIVERAPTHNSDSGARSPCNICLCGRAHFYWACTPARVRESFSIQSKQHTRQTGRERKRYRDGAQRERALIIILAAAALTRTSRAENRLQRKLHQHLTSQSPLSSDTP